MIVWRRIAILVVAAVMTASPAFACAGFCAKGRDVATVQGDDLQASPNEAPATTSMAALHEGCGDAGDAPQAPTPSYDEDCAGCPDCAGAMSVTKQALAASTAISVEAPIVVVLSGPLEPVQDNLNLARRRLTPPAMGPPLCLTPVSLKNILRI